MKGSSMCWVGEMVVYYFCMTDYDINENIAANVMEMIRDQSYSVIPLHTHV